MRFHSVGFALTIGMALIVVLLGFTLLSAVGLAGFSAVDETASQVVTGEPGFGCGLVSPPADTGATDLRKLPAAQAALVAAGDALFKSNCAQCHAVNEVLVGPALAGITKRRPISWLIPWVKNSSKVVASGDEYAVAIFSKYQQQMPSFALSDKEITSIIAYVSSEEGRTAVYGPTVAMIQE